MTTPNRSEVFGEELPLLRKAGWWFIATAIAFIVLGTLAIIEPFIAGLALATLVGWLLMVGGVMHGIGAFRGVGVAHTIWQVLVALFYVAVGLYFLTHPLVALGTLTLFLSGVLFAETFMDIVAYFSTRGIKGSGWLLVNAAVTFLLALMIWRQWPSISVWFIGTLFGVNLLVKGFSRLMLGTAARSLWREHAA
jgi:uncharacterized membrane protein HdeD (DUF308 family)